METRHIHRTGLPFDIMHTDSGLRIHHIAAILQSDKLSRAANGLPSEYALKFA
jgi:hypothetical protein